MLILIGISLIVGTLLAIFFQYDEDNCGCSKKKK